jgi:hypothetical protein
MLSASDFSAVTTSFGATCIPEAASLKIISSTLIKVKNTLDMDSDEK